MLLVTYVIVLLGTKTFEIYVTSVYSKQYAGFSALKKLSTDRKFFCTNLILRSFLKLSYCAVHQKTIIFFLFCLGLIDKGFLMGYLLYLASFLCLPVWGLLEDDIPPISSVVVTMEQVSVRNSDFNYSIQEQRAKVSDWGFWPYCDCHYPLPIFINNLLLDANLVCCTYVWWTER